MSDEDVDLSLVDWKGTAENLQREVTRLRLERDEATAAVQDLVDNYAAHDQAAFEAAHARACRVLAASATGPQPPGGVVVSTTTDPSETQHYIGMTPMGRLHLTLGPGSPAEFPTPPTEPATLANGSVLYPVSAEVAAEWDSFDAEGAAEEPWDDPALYDGWSLQGRPVETVTPTGERL